MEAVKGTNKTINYAKKGTCKICNGTKHKPGKPLTKCHTCNGEGRKVI